MDITKHILYYKILANYDAFPEIKEVFQRILDENGIKCGTRCFRKMVKDSPLDTDSFNREDKQALLALAVFIENFPPETVVEYINLGQKEKVAREIMRYLDEERRNVEKISYLLTRFNRIPVGKIHLPTTMTLNIRVNLITQFISSQLAYISIAKNFINMRDIAKILGNSVYSRYAAGLIGGKAAGMVLANRILRPTLDGYDHDFEEKIEEVDSFFVKSSIISEYTTLNKLEECHSLKYFEGEKFEEERNKLYSRFMKGRFSDDTIDQFKEILKKTKGSPLILRSSSFLEDSVGCSFTGKYDSFFITNTGSMEERLDELITAIKKVYFSLYSENVIQYRKDRQLLDYNERMSVLIQKVVGSHYGKYFLPALAMVGFSRNSYCWNKRIKPEDGMLRMVMGLGTRAVDRVGDDYPRMVSLSAPSLRPEVTNAEKIKYSQKYVDVLNLETRQVETVHFVDLVNELWENGYDFDVSDIVSVEENGVLRKPMFQPDRLEYDKCAITFDGLLNNRGFTSLLSNVLNNIEEAYGRPVDMEFAYHHGKLYILQCRTLYERDSVENVSVPEVDGADMIFTVKDTVCSAVVKDIKYIVYIDRNIYDSIDNMERKFEVARTVGKINRELEHERFIIMGPGRWGSSNINLGVPVKYNDINHTLILVEMGWVKDGVTPELSYGTHFFQDLVEADIIPLPLFPEGENSSFNKAFFDNAVNRFSDFQNLPDSFREIIKIINVPKESDGRSLAVYLDSQERQGVAVLE